MHALKDGARYSMQAPPKIYSLAEAGGLCANFVHFSLAMVEITQKCRPPRNPLNFLHLGARETENRTPKPTKATESRSKVGQKVGQKVGRPKSVVSKVGQK
jgi:hypothetical protein